MISCRTSNLGGFPPSGTTTERTGSAACGSGHCACACPPPLAPRPTAEDGGGSGGAHREGREADAVGPGLGGPAQGLRRGPRGRRARRRRGRATRTSTAAFCERKGSTAGRRRNPDGGLALAFRGIGEAPRRASETFRTDRSAKKIQL